MKKYFLSALMLMGITATAQTSITFDADDFESISVYDSWEQSPFRKGQLEGNVKVVSNHLNQVDEVLGEAPNATGKMLAFQRSRYAGNLYGARINLKKPFRLTKERKYVHVMINKPVESRVMVIGLGKRTEEAWQWQDGETEQFMAITNISVAADGWVDAVASFNGFSYEDTSKGGIEIHSLVVVPDVRSAHADAADFACYIDEILVDNNAAPRFSTEKYAVNFDRESGKARADRYMTSVGLTGGTLTPQSAKLSEDHNYYDLTTTTVFSAKAGQTITPTYGYAGTWMHTFTYVDFGCDGKFSVDLGSDFRPTAKSDLVSYQFLEVDGAKHNSTGGTPANGNLIGQASPAFTLPADLANGFYRMRYKVDWNETDAAGCQNAGNTILGNGGGIVDVMLDVHGDKVKVSQGALNGEVLAGDGAHFDNYTTNYGQPFKIKMDPADGFGHIGVRVKYGYNVSSPEQFDKNGNPHYLVREISYKLFDEDNCYTLPAEIMVGEEVYIEGLFVESKNVPDPNAKEASFPHVSPEPKAGKWAVGTKSYYIQNGGGQNGWMSTDYADASGNLQLTNATQPENEAGEWVVCGNDEDGYSFYNVAAGATKVLGVTGSEAGARAKLYAYGQEGSAVTTFDFAESAAGYSFRLHGTTNNCLNFRSPYLALWAHVNALSSDAGSRFTFFEANEELGKETEGLCVQPTVSSTLSATYDLQGRRLQSPARGLYMQDRRKLLKK